MVMPRPLVAQEDAETPQERHASPYEISLRLLAEDRIEEGTRAYREAVIRADSIALEVILEDARRFFDEREIESATARADGDVRGALVDLWMLRDPTPTEPGNEVLAESFERLAYVRDRFRSYRGGYHDRGRVWLRLGEPDEIVSTPVGTYLYPNESWLYRNVGGKRVVLHFVRSGAAYRLVPTLRQAIPPHTSAEYRRMTQRGGDAISPMLRELERLFVDRSSFDAVYVNLFFDVQKMDPGAIDNWTRHDYEPFLAAESQAVALSSFQVREGPEGEPADFRVRTVSFEEGTGYETWVVLGYPVIEIEEVPVEGPPGTATFAVERSVVLYDAAWEEVARLEGTRGMRVPTALAAPGNVLVDGTTLLSAAGSHHLGVRLRDVGSDRLAVYRLPVDLPPSDRGTLRISELLLADRIEEATGEGTFVRRGRRFVPSAANQFGGDRPPWLYFEVYGAAPGETHEVEITLRSSSDTATLPTRVFRTLEGWLTGRGEENAVTVRYAREATGESFSEALSIDVSALPEGSYRLEVAVEDGAGRTVERGTRLFIEGDG